MVQCYRFTFIDGSTATNIGKMQESGQPVVTATGFMVTYADGDVCKDHPSLDYNSTIDMICSPGNCGLNCLMTFTVQRHREPCQMLLVSVSGVIAVLASVQD